MQWNLRLRAAERGIWKSAQLRRMLAEAGLEISAGKMSSWWAGTPPTMRLEELDVLCAVLELHPQRPDDTRAGQGRRAPPPHHRRRQRQRRNRDGDRTATVASTGGRAAARQAPLDPTAVARTRRHATQRGATTGHQSCQRPDPTRALRLPPKCNRARATASRGPAPRVDFCYGCLPGGPFAPRRAARCGSHARLLQPGPVQPVPSPQPRAHRILQGLPGLGRLPPLQLDLLVLQVVAKPLPKGTCAYCGRDSHVSEQRSLSAVPRERPPRTETRPSTRRRRGEHSTASSCSSPTWSSSGA